MVATTKRMLTFTTILEFCSPVYKRIYFIEFISELYWIISELYIESTVLGGVYMSPAWDSVRTGLIPGRLLDWTEYSEPAWLHWIPLN